MTEHMAMQRRFQLEDATIQAFGDEFLVACPRCSRRAVVQNRGSDLKCIVRLRQQAVE